ncbi:hypothetical protein KCU98_g194, partial [Aureobasidium melanogenum]
MPGASVWLMPSKQGLPPLNFAGLGLSKQLLIKGRRDVVVRRGISASCFKFVRLVDDEVREAEGFVLQKKTWRKPC